MSISFYRVIYLLIYLTLLPASSWAQQSIGKIRELFKVDQIVIKGTRKVEPEAVLEKMKIQEGMLIDNYLLRKDLKNIYKMKFFEKVEAHQIKVKNKNILEIRLSEKPIIRTVKIRGNSEIKDDDIFEQIKTKEYGILDVSTIKSDIQAIVKFYEEKGFYLATADYKIDTLKDKSVGITFEIKELDKVIVKKIMFLGNENIPDDDLKSFMQTKEESLFSFLTDSGSFKDFNFQTDIERLAYLYKSRGYLQVNISAPSITVSQDKKWIFITMKINEGPKFYVNNIYFNGEMLFREEQLRETIKLKPEEVYSEDSLRQDIQKLTEMYQDKGYAFANVLRTLDIVPGENKVDINFSFEKGKIAYFGDIIIKGNSKTRDKVIRRELRIHEGMMYSGSMLRISKERVNRLGFFEPNSVVFNTISPKGKDNILDVEISIKERQTGQISLGAGYSTATKGFIQFSVAQNNFRGLGQNLRLSGSLNQNQSIYNIGFTEPYLFDSLWTGGADLYKTFNNLLAGFRFEKYGANLRVGYPIFEYTRMFLTYNWETTRVSNVEDPSIDESLENGVASGVTVSFIHDKRNNIFEPTDGYFGNGSVEYVGVGGEQRWIRTELEGRLYEPIWGDLVFRSRISASRLTRTTERGIPRSERFVLGGPRDMRGFPINSLGPRTDPEQDPRGRTFPTGGLFSFISTFELEHPLVREAGLKWVVFYDAGNVFTDYMGKDGEIDLEQNWGFGFRWFSPIGVLRFEFAYPMKTEVPGAEGQQFFFDIGQLF